MSKEDLEKEIAKGNINTIAFYNSDGSNMLYTQKYVEEKDKEIQRLNNIIEELEKWLEGRRTHYCMGCSNIYEDSLGKTRLVNEDIFNEVTKIKDKLKELKEDVK